MAKHKEKTWLEATLREFRWSFVVTALAFAALGLVLMLWPDASMHVLCYLVGGALTLYGGFNVLNFVFSRERAFTLRDLELSSWWVRLLLSVAAAILGALFMVQKELFGRALLIVIGAVLLYQGLSDLISVIQISILGKRLKKTLGAIVQDNIIDTDS